MIATTDRGAAWRQWCAAVHEAGHLIGFMSAGLRPKRAWADSRPSGEATAEGRFTSEYDAQVAAVCGMMAVDCFTNATAAEAANMSPEDRRMYCQFDPHAITDLRTVELRMADARALCLAHEKLILKLARHMLDNRSVEQSDIAYFVRRTARSACFRPLFKGVSE